MSSNVHSILTLSAAIPGPWLELSSQTMRKSRQADAVSLHMELTIMKHTLSLWPNHRQGLGYLDDLHLGRREHRIGFGYGAANYSTLQMKKTDTNKRNPRPFSWS